MCRAKTAEPIELLFELVSGVGPPSGRAHWRHLVNTTERLCAAAMSGSAPLVATRPVTKLLWAILFALPVHTVQCVRFCRRCRVYTASAVWRGA